jgi:phage terminase large subunit GpA-like protein
MENRDLQAPVGRRGAIGASPADGWRLPRHRTIREFAEQEIRLPEGPRKGMRYSTSFMPFSRELLDEFQRGRFHEYWGSGPAQASKTLHFLIIPALYHLFELEDDVIIGAPVVGMAKSAYLKRILPVIKRSTRYRGFVPTKGPGSRGGVADLIQFGNGASLRFLGAGGGDHQLAGYTARIVLITEVDKMDTAGDVSREADPVSKLIARTKSFEGRGARVYAECTMSIKEGRIYRQVVELGTDSRVFLRCHHCREWIWPERSGLVGWHEAPDEMDARARARYQCPKCGGQWSELDRRRALEDPRVVARTQKVLADGTVDGSLPPTTSYGFRWNAMASPLTSIEAIAAEEWKAEQSGTDDDAKAVTQHTWAEAWEKAVEDLFRPDAEAVLRKIVRLERGTIPDGTLRMTMGIDVGIRIIWWALVAWRAEARGHVVDFGAVDVPQGQHGERNPVGILQALREFRDTVVKAGWGPPDARRQPDRILLDSGYEQEVAYQFVKESGEPHWLACRGFGTSSRYGAWSGGPAAEPSKTQVVLPEYRVVLQPSGIRLIMLHADYWRTLVHDGFFAPEGAPGSITLFHGDPRTDVQLRQFARHMVAEQREYIQAPGKEQKLVWVVKQRMNHWLDCKVYARCAADIEGIKLVTLAQSSVPASRSYLRPASTIRTKY